MSQLWLVPPSQVLGIASEVSKILEPAITRSLGRYEIWDVIALIMQGHMQLWVSANDGKIEACCVTHIIPYPRAKVLGFSFTAGKDLDHWLPFMDEVIEWAKAQGCTQIEAYDGRKGAWARKLGWDENYRLIGTTI